MPDDDVKTLDKEKQGDQTKDQDKDKSKDIDPDRIITPEKLQGVISAHRRTVQGELQSEIDKLKASLKEEFSSSVAAALKELEDAKDSGKKPKVKDEGNPELASLRRKMEDVEKKNNDLLLELQDTKNREKSTRMKNSVMDLLNKAGCDNSPVVYKFIEERLDFGDDGETVYAKNKNEFGDTENVPIEDFIKKDVRETLVPGLFKGANRSGAPADGDSSGKNRRMKFDYNKVKDDPAILVSDEFMEALDKGEVANTPDTKR